MRSLGIPRRPIRRLMAHFLTSRRSFQGRPLGVLPVGPLQDGVPDRPLAPEDLLGGLDGPRHLAGTARAAAMRQADEPRQHEGEQDAPGVDGASGAHRLVPREWISP